MQQGSSFGQRTPAKTPKPTNARAKSLFFSKKRVTPICQQGGKSAKLGRTEMRRRGVHNCQAAARRSGVRQSV